MSTPEVTRAFDFAYACTIEIEGRRLVLNEIRRLVRRKAPAISATLVAENIAQRIAPKIHTDDLRALAKEELRRRWGS